MSESSDRELDALVAEKVMGYPVCFYTSEGWHAHQGDHEWLSSAANYPHFTAEPDRSRFLLWREPDTDGVEWQPSVDISAAMEVVEKMRDRLAKQGFPLIVMETPLDSCKWRVRFGVGFNEGLSKGIIAEADTLPRAICNAALKACEVYTEMVEKT